MKATYIVHWPGKSTPACDDHKKQLEGLGVVMGIRVASTPVANNQECTNCANEAAQ